ncbi:MAG: hypothetical protein IJT54_05155 [Candidatus Methanomethylophilaceae archaeon]|nr:hypothetical protein [Candidatus Methanomethylophilaceae archaeon]
MEYRELKQRMMKHNEGFTFKGDDPSPIYAVVVLKDSNFEDNYTELQRSFRFSSDNKAFLRSMSSNSIFATSMDGKNVVRLHDLIWDENGTYRIDYCYIEGDETTYPFKITVEGTDGERSVRHFRTEDEYSDAYVSLSEDMADPGEHPVLVSKLCSPRNAFFRMVAEAEE